MVLDENNPEQYFNAFLWGTQEAAARDAVLVFYSVSYDENGSIVDAEFNFVEKTEFDCTYDLVQE